jgi:hypothetical protein
MTVAHYVIAAPGRDARALDVLRKAGIDAEAFPAIMAGPLSDTLAQMPYQRFGGGTIARTPAQHGAYLSHMALVAMARCLGVEWLGVWEDDLGVGDQIGWRELRLPPDCGVVYLGGILWGEARDYGEDMGDGLWRVTQPRPISGTHAVMINRRAMDDVLASYARADMTIDDLLSCACIDAMNRQRWSTCFVQPWLAWQVDRRETWPS